MHEQEYQILEEVMLIDCSLSITIDATIHSNGKNGRVEYSVFFNDKEQYKKEVLFKNREKKRTIETQISLEPTYLKNNKVQIRYKSFQDNGFIVNFFAKILGSTFEGIGESENIFNYSCARNVEGMVFVQGGSINLDTNSIKVESFYIDRREVSYAEWRMKRGTCGDVRPTAYYPYNKQLASRGGSDCPIVWVDWDEANCFCERMGKRLLRKDEWEYAVLEGIFFSEIKSTYDQLNCSKNNTNIICESIHESPFLEIENLNCNVLEWVQDENIDNNGEASVKGGGSLNYKHRETINYVQTYKKSFKDENVGFRCARKIE